MFRLLFLEEEAPVFNWNAFFHDIVYWCTHKGLQIVLTIIFVAILFKIVDAINRAVKKKLVAKHADKTITKLIYYTLGKVLKFIILLIAVASLGVETASIAGLLTSAGLAVGLAVQGALSNLAGGIIIILTRPFRVDDYISAMGIEGTVEDIHIFHTIIHTVDNKQIHVPNGQLINGNITNYSVKPTRRVDITFCIPYEIDFYEAEKIVLDEVKNNESVLISPEPTCRVTEMADSSINITLKVWCNNADYWPVKNDLTEKCYKALEAKGISAPFPQLDVKIKDNEEVAEATPAEAK